MAITNNPTNQNFLGPTTFQFSIHKLPNCNFFIQKANVPGISMSPVFQANPLVKIPHPGDHMDYEEFQIEFKIDEDLQNYTEIYNWIRGMGFSENTEEYRAIAGQKPGSGLGIFSDAELIVLDAKKRPNFKLTFIDSFPISLSSIQMEYDVNDVQYVTATATFVYQTYQIERIKGK